MRIAIYVRVSTQRQAQTQTIDQQIERLRAHSGPRAGSCPRRTSSVTTATAAPRSSGPASTASATGAAMASFDKIFVTDPDRLARNYVHQVLLLEELQKHGCRVEFLDRPMSQDPHDQLLLQIRGAVAEYERTLIAERTRRGRPPVPGRPMLPWTRAPYGYRMAADRPRDPSGVYQDPAEAAVVAEMFAWYLETDAPCSGWSSISTRWGPLADGQALLGPRLAARGPDQPRLHRPGLRRADPLPPRQGPPLGDPPDRPAARDRRARPGGGVDRRGGRPGRGRPGAVRPKWPPGILI